MVPKNPSYRIPIMSQKFVDNSTDTSNGIPSMFQKFAVISTDTSLFVISSGFNHISLKVLINGLSCFI